ncbi:hypothetical protein MY11210_005430 [Beauveria gryllotalpidicola]
MSLAESFSPIYLRLWLEIDAANKKFLIGYALISASAGVLSSLFTRVTLGFLSKTDSGSLLNRYSEDMEGLSKRVPTKMYSMLYFSFVILINVGAILAGATYMAAILPAVFGCLYFIQRYGQRGYLARPDLHMANGQIEHVDVWDNYQS